MDIIFILQNKFRNILFVNTGNRNLNEPKDVANVTRFQAFTINCHIFFLVSSLANPTVMQIGATRRFKVRQAYDD